MSCIIEIKDSAVYKALKRKYGTDETKIYTYWTHAIENGEFTNKFQKWYQAKRKTTKPITIDNVNTRTIAKDLEDYYNRTKPNGNATVLDKTDDPSGNYTSVADRKFCIRIVGSEMLDIFRDERYGKHNNKPITTEFYINAVRTQFASRLLDILGITKEEMQARIDKKNLVDRVYAYMKLGETKQDAIILARNAEFIRIAREMLGENITTQDSNFLATFEEMINSEKDAKGKKISYKFFDTVFNDSRLSNIRRKNNEFNTDEEDKAQDNENVELGEPTSETDNTITDTFDVSFRVFDSHDGQYSTFMTHVGGNIHSYLNSLRKLTTANKSSDGKYSYNTKNAIGIAYTMNANECAMMLYTQADYTNVPSMIKSIRNIAERVDGFQAFSQLADDLANDYDFAYEFYRTFGKIVMAKKETYIENGERKSRISNTTANKLDALRFEYINSLRSSSTNILADYALPEAKRINEAIEAFNKNLSTGEKYKKEAKKLIPFNKDTDEYKIDRTKIIAAFTENIKRYLPTIDKSVIINFIEGNKKDGVVDEIYNMTILYKDLVNIINGAHDTKLNYVSKQAQSSKIARENRPIIEAIANASPEDGMELAKGLKDVSEIWASELLTTKAKQAAIELANHLVPYATVKLELNSRNAQGNLSSDVINSSMITNFMNMLQSALNTEDNDNSPIKNYAAYKFRSKQYINSNILVEKVVNGKIINKGLFRLVNGKYVPTPYAADLIRMELFNGISDFGSGKSAVYANMSQGDYVTTAMINFNKSTHTHKDMEFADYMMRIPSDAPKNFIYSAPVYRLNYKDGNETISFWQIDDKKAVTNRVKELINNLPHKELNDYDDAGMIADGHKVMDVEDAVKLLTNRYKDSIKIYKNDKSVTRPNKNSTDVYINIKTDDVDFIVKGTIDDTTNEVSNIKLEGIVNNYYGNVAFGSELNTALSSYYEKQLIKGNLKLADGSTVNLRINRQHPIFQQFYHAFKQEAQDAATAIDKIFTHKNGQIIFKNGQPLYSEYFAGLADKDRATYANYHRKENKYIDKNGIEHKETGIIQNVWLPVKDEKGKIKYWEKTNNKRLSGNVFNSDRFIIFDENNKAERNFLSEVFSEEVARTDDNKLHLFYGGANSYLHINDNGEVEFTAAQQQLIEDKLEEFIKAYINNSIERISKFNNLLEGTPHSEDDIAEFMLNYHLAYISCNDLFEGDSKFYKNSQDFLKRGKEVQGSGVPYGIVDFTRPMFGESNVEVEGAYLNTPEMQAVVGKLHNCKQFTTFKAVTVKNTIRTSIESQTILVDQLTKNFKKEGLDESSARKKAETMMKGYKNTKVNDAQSYITFEEWIRRIAARGQLHKYKPLIEAILDESKPLDVADIDEFIQVQKNFYFDQYYNEATGVMAPRQIKNAEFVLVPRLIRGTELEQVYNAMVHYGIDQLNTEETSKAGKVNVLTLWDNDGNLTKEWLQDFNSNVKGAIEIFSYNYLYTQQETPQHLNAENKAGIQIMKKIIDNIDETLPSGEHNTLWDVKQRFLENYSQNIRDSHNNLMTELGVTIDENGKIVTDDKGRINGLDYSVFLSKLKDEMIRLGLDSNKMDFVTLKDIPLEDKSGQNGFGLQSKMPAFLNNDRKKFESVSQAVFNNSITRQKLPGFHAAQITQIGFKLFKNTVKERTYSRQLRYHPNGERHIEIMLPASAFGLNRNDEMWKPLREKYEKDGFSVEEIEAKIDSHMLEYLKNKGLDTIIGYRIPTEGKQSVCVMKVVGFTPDAYGSTIVVPDDWVAQTGSDFDIDSVYGIQYSVRKDKDGSLQKIKYNTNPKENYISYVLRSLDKDSKEELLVAKKSDKFELAKQLAKENNLATFEDYSKQSISAQNSREARNNQILDDMITILQSDEALEENVSQSQFKDIIDDRDEIMSDIDKARRNSRSPYNFLDQAEYQEDAMSGAKLKAFSVTLDTFCSICNTVKPTFSKPIEIVYPGDKAKFKELQARFDSKKDGEWIGNVVQLDNSHILVKHTGLGYSIDNKNVVGKILTAYSSQTTAHILDAIKEGAIKNVNDLTFGIYKLFPNIGSDYKTAISFMMQPGVTEIVNAYNKNKSIYAKGYENPTNSAIRSIAKRLDIKTKKASIQFIEGKLQELIEANGMTKVNVLNSERLTDRIKEQGTLFSSPVKKLLFDYLVVKKYQDLSSIAGKIGALTRVCNPDKFGAKQTIYQTNKIFEDILDILNDEAPVFGRQNNKSFLERIYPGISKIKTDGIDGFIANNDEDSAYPPLYNFLKYASATSIKINRMLFVTQSTNFRDAVNRIKNIISNNKRLDEETYNAFEKYILCDLYRQVPIIANPITYSYKKGIDYDKSSIRFTEERERIFGYGYQPNLKTINSEGNVVDLDIVDKSHPTEDEIKMFIKLTPAQKVYYIQQNFTDGLVCKYLKTNLVNSKEYRKDKSDSQTIEFIEDGTDIETVYSEFYNTFANKNPLLALTAMDIIKYAFVVEGYQMTRGAVNKIIKNEILINEKGLTGTGIEASLCDVVGNFVDHPDMNRVEQLIENFVRSHPKIQEISHTYLYKNDFKRFNVFTNNVLTIFDNADNNEFLVEHGFGFNIKVNGESQFVPNSYIVIRSGKNQETLYKITGSNCSNTIYLTPLNLLQGNETSTWSVNMGNNKFPSADYYTELIQKYEQQHEDWNGEDFIRLQKELKAEGKTEIPKRAKIEEDIAPNDNWDINDDSIGSISILKQAIKNHFNGTTSSMLILESPFLEDKIKGFGIENGVRKIVDGNPYYIYRLNTKHISTIPGNEGANLFDYTSKQGLNREISAKDKPFEELINRARQRGIDSGHPGEAHIRYAYAVIPAISNDNVRNSAITETLTRTDKAIRRTARNDESLDAEKYEQQMSRRSIESNRKSISNNEEEVLISTAEYISAAVEKILNGENGLNLFTQDPETGSYLKITDPKVLDLIRESPVLRRKYLKTLLKAKHLIDKFESFSTIKYAENEQNLKYYVDRINNEIKRLSDSSILKEAEELYVTGYLAKITNNPNIANNIVSLLDSYHSTTYLASWLNDLQETTNPIIQIITSDVMSDIRAKEFQGEQRAREFRKFIRDIKAKAARNGRSIDWKNLIDEYGKWINDYDNKFIEDLEALRTEKDNAYSAYKNATDDFDKADKFEQYLKSKLKYDEWKLANTHQELVDDYYRKMIDLEKSMINTDTGKFSDIYVEWKMLNDQLRDIYSHLDANGKLDAHYEAKRDEILSAIKNLKADAIRTPLGDYIQKTDLEEYEVSNDPVIRRNQNINSISAAVRLRDFIQKRNELNDEYHSHTERFGFRDQLERYRSTIRKYENRGLTEDDLYAIPEYVAAKNWVKQNAYFQYNLYKNGEHLTEDEVGNLLEEYYDNRFDRETQDFSKRVRAALAYLRKTAGERHNNRAIYKRITLAHDARDENGVIDARMFTPEEIAEIKKEQEARYGIGESVPFSERSIIHNSTTDNTIYTSEFYKGMNVGGVDNPTYLQIVKNINKILYRVINPSTGVLETSNLSIEEINAVLEEFAKLGYDRTEQTFNTADGPVKHTGVKRKDVLAVKKFIDKNVEFVLTEKDKRRFENEKHKARKLQDEHGGTYYLAWCELNQEWDEAKQEFVPNHLLWGHAQPKESLPKAERDNFISKKKTAAVNILREVFTEKNTKYYDMERSRMLDTYGAESAEFKEWEDKNHIYNPHTHKFEPLVCWTVSEPNDNMPGEWEPTYQMTDKGVKPEYANSNYLKGLGVAGNYKNNGNQYQKTNSLNEEEKELRTYVQTLLSQLATTKKAKKYIEQGNLPTKAVKEDKSAAKLWLTELAKGFGYIEGNLANNTWNSDTEISYDTDYVPEMPMLQQLVSKDTHRPPFREAYSSDSEYQKAKEEYENHKKEYEKENREIHKNLIDNNWEEVIAEFITKAAHYNAVQDNKLQLYFGQQLINDIQTYQTRLSNPNHLVKDGSLTTEDEVVYRKKVDKNLQDQYANFVRRVIFDQYKKNQGKKTRLMQVLQNITSTSYMTLNFRGGIANITVGESNIWGEVFAKEYFGTKDWAVGKGIWLSAIPSFTANMYNDTSTTLADAIVKRFNIVDYDEVRGIVSQKDFEEWAARVRNATYANQTIGEHFMQNAAMFSMMMSHRVVPNPKYGQPGEPKYTFMTKEEYIAHNREQALPEDELENYRNFLNTVKEDPDKVKDYARFKTDPVTHFVTTRLSKEKQEAFAKKEKEIRKEAAKTFSDNPTVYSQFKLGEDGKLDFADNSILAKMNTLTTNQEVTDAYKFMGKFKGRIISVNKKIHGNYGKLDAARLEQEWFGGLLMQYHKHIYPGIMKRWRRQGYWNEERGTVEKGSYVALYDFLTAPIKQIAERNGLSEGQTEALTGIQKLFGTIVNYFHFLKLNLAVMPEYEKANMRRVLGDVSGMLLALLGACLLRLGWDDDDDSLVYNLGLYEMDRLASETFMWNPIGLYSEGKKLWSSPIAAQSIIGDGMNILGTISGILLEGEDYDPYFHGGRYNGEHKLRVYIERRIPYWRNWVAIRDIADNNHYYKMGDNLTSWLGVDKINKNN